MIKSTLPIIFVVGMTYLSTAQATDEYSFSVTGKLIVNEINKIAFEGHDGNEVIITTTAKSSKSSERAEGLRLINGSGLEDNTGLGISVNTSNGNTQMDEISKRSSRRYTVKIPKGIVLAYEHSTAYGSKVTFTDITNEIEVKTNHSGLILENVTGPMTVSTVHGKIEAVFGSVNQNGPVSIVSSHGLVDISLPSDTKADLKLSSNWGEIYSDMDIAIEKSNNLKSYSSNVVKGTLNGGGVNFSVSSTHGNIYLRKK